MDNFWPNVFAQFLTKNICTIIKKKIFAQFLMKNFCTIFDQKYLQNFWPKMFAKFLTKNIWTIFEPKYLDNFWLSVQIFLSYCHIYGFYTRVWTRITMQMRNIRAKIFMIIDLTERKTIEIWTFCFKSNWLNICIVILVQTLV